MSEKIFSLHLITIISSFLFSSCAMVTAESVTPDNKKTYGIDCSGKMVPKEYCYQKAAELCPNGYKVIADEAPTIMEKETATSDEMVGLKIAEKLPLIRKGITVVCN